MPRQGFARAAVARAVALGGVAVVMLAVSATPAMAVSAMSSSKKVALIPSNVPSPQKGINGIMPISSYVSGNPGESFDKFSFTNVAVNQITSTELSHFDTVALIQVKVSTLTSAEKTALAQFVANGGKLIIHDADETIGNDYSWILGGGYTTGVGASCNGCGSTSGSSAVTANSGLISANPSDPTYVNLAEMGQYTDAIGDANLLVSNDPRWFAVAGGKNGKGEAGAQFSYATNNGLVMYNGFDTDLIKANQTDPWRCIYGGPPNYTCSAKGGHESVDWLAQMWYNELNASWGSASSGTGTLPGTTPVSSIGTPVPPAQAGLPTAGRCVAHRTLFLRLKQLVRRHRRVVQIDVYVNGRHVLTERNGHWRNVTLGRLPQKGSYVVKIVATTNRRYHLISKMKYRAC